MEVPRLCIAYNGAAVFRAVGPPESISPVSCYHRKLRDGLCELDTLQDALNLVIWQSGAEGTSMEIVWLRFNLDSVYS